MPKKFKLLLILSLLILFITSLAAFAMRGDMMDNDMRGMMIDHVMMPMRMVIP